MLLLADPIILLMPEENEGLDEWSSYFDYLINCNDIIDDEIHQITLSQICEDALYYSERFPQFPQQLQQWLLDAGIVAFDANTLLSILRRIAHEAPRLEDIFDINIESIDEPVAVWINDGDVLIEQKNIEITPELLVSRLINEPDLLKAFHLTTGVLAFLEKETQGLGKDEFAILTTFHSNDEVGFDHVQIIAVMTEKTDLSRRVEIKAQLSPSELIHVIEEAEIFTQLWPDIEAVFQHMCQSSHHTTLPKYQFSDNTISYLQKNKGLTIFILKKILRLLESIRDGSSLIDNNKNHRLINQDSDGDWEPWRYWITRDGERLHYWWRRNNKGTLIFSHLLTDHDTYTIDSNMLEKSQLS
jgi:hypothetical protein